LPAAQLAASMAVGAAAATFELAEILRLATAAGTAAARQAGLAAAGVPEAPDGWGDGPPRLEPCWRSPCTLREEKRQFVDLQNDVTVADVRAALDEGFTDIEHVKRYTALGVGTEQGATSRTLGAGIVAELLGRPPDAIGNSRARPPYRPVTLQALAGLRRGAALRVTRRTPLHDWHVAHGGVLDPMGSWLRPRYYRSNGRDAFTAAVAEASRVRATGGIVDASTLGKIEIAGADAAAFLDTLYVARASEIKPGRARYMVNLREDGIVLDDGLVLRLAENRFVATTGSGHAAHLLSHFEHYRDTQWASRHVTVTDVTDAWAVIAVAGPQSRTTLLRVLEPRWRDAITHLGHMALGEGHFEASSLRIVRAGFSGELAYELHVRPGSAARVWQGLVDAGLAPYGLDALDILRVEKGYLTSSEINGETTPFDLNMDGLLRAGNACVGRELLERPAYSESSRPRLVGLQAVDASAPFRAGAQLTVDKTSTRPCGYITSAAFSPALARWVALGLVARSLANEATVLQARDPLRGTDVAVRVCSPVHVDPRSARMLA
jgi:glycine cleavage system aminomethyltransferase T